MGFVERRQDYFASVLFVAGQARGKSAGRNACELFQLIRHTRAGVALVITFRSVRHNPTEISQFRQSGLFRAPVPSNVDRQAGAEIIDLLRADFALGIGERFLDGSDFRSEDTVADQFSLNRADVRLCFGADGGEHQARQAARTANLLYRIVEHLREAQGLFLIIGLADIHSPGLAGFLFLAVLADQVRRGGHNLTRALNRGTVGAVSKKRKDRQHNGQRRTQEQSGVSQQPHALDVLLRPKHHALFLGDLLRVEVVNEEGPRLREQASQVLQLFVGEVGAEKVEDRLAFLQRAGEVEASEEQRLGEDVLGEQNIHTFLEAVLQRPKSLRKRVDPAGFRVCGLPGQEAQPQLLQPSIEFFKASLELRRLERCVEIAGARPTEQLVSLKRIKLVVKLGEPRDQITLGDQQKHGEPDVQNCLNLPQTVAQNAGALVAFFGGVRHQLVGR